MTLQEEAEKMYPVNKTGSMWMPSKDEVNNQYRQEGFIAGVTSKYVEAEKIMAKIDAYQDCLYWIDDSYNEKYVHSKIIELHNQLENL